MSAMPGPAAYDLIEPDFGKHGQKYTLRAKTSPWKRDDVPGPGAYSPGEELHSLGVYKISKHAGSKAPKIGPFAHKIDIRPAVTDSPGPGAYETKPNLSSTGTYFLQGYQNSRCRTFTKASRRLVSLSSSSTPYVDTPGPGAYSYSSDFGPLPEVSKQTRSAVKPAESTIS